MSKKNLINLLFLGIMVLAIPLTINLVRQQQILLSRAAETRVEFLTKELGGTDCVVNRDNKQLAVCKDIAVRFTAPTGADIRLQSSTSLLPQEGFVGKANAQECTGNQFQGYREEHNGQDCEVWYDQCQDQWGWQHCKDPAPACTGNWHDAGYTEPHDNQTCEVWTDGCNNWDWRACQSPSVASNSNEGQACGDEEKACSGGTILYHKTIQNDDCVISSNEPCSGSTGGDQCPSGTKPVSGHGDYLVNDTVVKDGNGQCGYMYYVWSSTLSSDKYCANNDDKFGAWDNQPDCLARYAAQHGSSGGVAIGTGGCCSGNSDCKASNTYQGQSTADWTCTDTNPACSGGKACKAPAGTKLEDGAACTIDSQCKSNNCPTGPNSPSRLHCAAATAGDTTTKRDDGVACTIDSQCKSNNCPSNSNNPSFQKCLGSSVVDTKSAVITKYRFAENPTDLATAAWKSYSAGGVVEHYSISDTTPGQKFVFVQFQDSAGNITERKSGSIAYSGPDPVITGSACNINLDLKDGSLIFQANGDNFGARELSASTLTADNSNLEIKEWTNQKVIARMVNPPDTASGKTYTVTTTRSDGVKATSSCGVNTTQISLGAKLFCRAPSNFDQENVSLTIIQNKLGVGTSVSGGNFQAGDKAKETVTITKEGVIQNLKTKLQEGMDYIICIKAPKSLRICTDKFTAVAGNNIIQNFNLPVGDVNGDDVINSVDAGICKAEWGSGTGTKACEFNRDNTTNSFEWSCLMHDYGKSSQAEPI